MADKANDGKLSQEELNRAIITGAIRFLPKMSQYRSSYLDKNWPAEIYHQDEK